ncbi:MAG: SDR family oxidoreductase [Planctomycetes bacterium]|nr:SDR family oxidoreductase [Planctomycetota bacterium]
MDLGLRHKSVLVTGGSRGIGRAIARAFCREEASVIICGRSAKHLIEAAKEIGEVRAQVCDVRRAGEIRRFLRRLDRLDVLINNAGGMQHFGRFEDTSAESWLSAFELNVVSAAEMTRHALPLLRRSRGCIVNICSEVAKQPFETGPDYCAAKAALLNLSKYLANELAPHGVRVNAVCPGPVVTDSWWEESGWSAARLREISKAAAKRVALGRVGHPEDVAGLTVFLASTQASWVTGAAFSVDGGAIKSIF